MGDQVYKTIELTGTSATSMEEAVNTALAKAGESVRQMRWFEVVEIRGTIGDNKVGQWQVTLKIGFSVED
ncbi:MAG: dodecin domain-containing protein [Anaerolineae bacterium]|nr:dodecin domain-containing protein [Anaerolineae bacterium]